MEIDRSDPVSSFACIPGNLMTPRGHVQMISTSVGQLDSTETVGRQLRAMIGHDHELPVKSRSIGFCAALLPHGKGSGCTGHTDDDVSIVLVKRFEAVLETYTKSLKRNSMARTTTA